MISTISFKLMDVLDNCPGSNELSGQVRVVDIQFGKIDTVWLIDRDRTHQDKLSQRKGYFCQPYCLPLAEVEELLQTSKCVVLNVRPAGSHTLPDKDQLNHCKSEKARSKLLKQFLERDNRFNAIRPLVCAQDGNYPLPVSRVLSDPDLARRIKERSQELGRSPSTLRNWMNRYWSGGFQRSALIAGYSGKCGSPGKPKKQESKLGRSPRLFKTGVWNSRGYAISEQDKRRLGSGFALISKERTPYEAYLLTCSAHWAVHEESSTGEIKAVLYPKEQRPSFDQFMRWGEKLHGYSVSEIILGPTKSAQRKMTSGGSERDSIVGVGQQAMFDGTSNDVYLTSFTNRLVKLPPMTRLILKESRLGLIYGVYCGWEAPSPATALLAVLHGALEDKTNWAARFGVSIKKDDIPGMLPRSVLADNGELKSQETTEFELQFGTGFLFTPTGRGDKKGGVESEHKRMHQYVDHRIPGTTHGKRRSRGETHPASEALWNYPEYMAELIRYIVWNNTQEEVPDLAPDKMLLLAPSIKPTRINIYKWLTDDGLNVGLNFNYDDLRAYALPDIEAVVCKNGIRIIKEIHGRKQRIPRLRYTSEALAKTGLMTQVKTSGKNIHVKLKMDPTDLSQAWLPTRGGLIRVIHSSRDRMINKNVVLNEWIGYCEQQVLINDMSRDSKEQQNAEKAQRFEAVSDAAKTEVKFAMEALNKKPSKKSLISHLEKNKKLELDFLKAQDQARDEDAPPKEAAKVMNSISASTTLADDAMSAFLGDE